MCWDAAAVLVSKGLVMSRVRPALPARAAQPIRCVQVLAKGSSELQKKLNRECRVREAEQTNQQRNQHLRYLNDQIDIRIIDTPCRDIARQEYSTCSATAKL